MHLWKTMGALQRSGEYHMEVSVMFPGLCPHWLGSSGQVEGQMPSLKVLGQVFL